MNARPLTDAQISGALRAHLPQAAAPGLRDRVFDRAANTAQLRSFPSFLRALSDADPVARRRSLLLAAALLVALAVASAAAVGGLRLLEREDLATPETDYTLAIAMLKTLRNKDINFASRDRSHSAGLFGKILKHAALPLPKMVDRDARIFGAPDLLYLGFVFSERQGPEREFGLAVLKVVAKRFGGSEEGKTAKNKLKTQGG